MTSFEEYAAILDALPRGLYADNLLDIAQRAKNLAESTEHNVATWLLVHLGCVALAACWEEPVSADAVADVERTLLPACREAIENPSVFTTEHFARELTRALARLNADY
jgi:hypothetical protein